MADEYLPLTLPCSLTITGLDEYCRIKRAPDQLQTLTERRDYLVIRIEGKRKLGWETQYDEREHRALCWALGKLAPSEDDGA